MSATASRKTASGLLRYRLQVLEERDRDRQTGAILEIGDAFCQFEGKETVRFMFLAQKYNFG